MLTVRPATPSDAPALARLRYEFRAPRGTVVEDEPAFLARCERWMRERLTTGGERDDDARWRAWVAVRERVGETGGEIVGTVWLALIEKLPNPTPEPEEHAYVTNLYVRPDARGGAGSALLAAALRWCEARRPDAVILWPTRESRSLYARHGFAPPPALMERVMADGDGAS